LSFNSDPESKEAQRSHCYDYLKNYLMQNSKFLSEFIQISNLNLIYDSLKNKYPTSITNEKLFKFTLSKSNLDKYSGKDYKDLVVEVTYQMSD
jgi:hypothetical protein